MKRGDFVRLRSGEASIDAMVLLASENEQSLAVAFDGMFRGYVGFMPLLKEGDEYRDLIGRQIIDVELLPRLKVEEF